MITKNLDTPKRDKTQFEKAIEMYVKTDVPRLMVEGLGKLEESLKAMSDELRSLKAIKENQ